VVVRGDSIKPVVGSIWRVFNPLLYHSRLWHFKR
jgi:hypothetical protein